jgi:hypothetical protein
LPSRVKYQINGTLWKIPEINVKHVVNIIYHVNIKKYDLINYKDHGCISHASLVCSLASYMIIDLIVLGSLYLSKVILKNNKIG